MTLVRKIAETTQKHAEMVRILLSEIEAIDAATAQGGISREEG
jgi:hypothetical protein